MIEHLPNKGKALSSTTSTTKKKSLVKIINLILNSNQNE
jgi:hypothetical protein